MLLIDRIAQFAAAHNVASGPHGPKYVAAGYTQTRFPGHFYNHDSWVVAEQTRLAAGATITALVLSVRHAPSFDPLQVHMPVLFAHAPQGLAEPRAVLVRAIVRQHLAHVLIFYVELAGALILLGYGQPRQAWRMIAAQDGQTIAHKAMALDLFVGVPLYAGLVACKVGAAMVKRTLDAQVS